MEHNGSCYHFSTRAANHSFADFSCQDLGFHLVVIETPEEQDFLVDNLLNPDVNHWIGLTTDARGNRVWFADASNVTYTNYGLEAKFVDDDGGICFRLRPSKNYTWYDMNCSYSYWYICERKSGEYLYPFEVFWQYKNHNKIWYISLHIIITSTFFVLIFCIDFQAGNQCLAHQIEKQRRKMNIECIMPNVYLLGFLNS